MEGSAIQSSDSAELGRMTSDEAQAVIDLWAQRQRQFEDEATTPSTAELAEALNVPESEIAAMLRRVRNEVNAKVIEAKGRTPVLHRPKWLVIALAAFLILGLVVSFISSAVKPTSAPVSPIPFSVADAALAPMATAETSSIDEARYLPEGVSVRFDGQSLLSVGSMSPNLSNQALHLSTMQTIESFVQKQSNYPKTRVTTVFVQSKLNRSLIDGTDQFPDYIIWRDLEITIGSDTITSKIPISISDNEAVNEAVNSEVSRRISKITSQAVEKFRALNSSQLTPAPPAQ